MHTFYVQQRKRLNILVNKGKPVGGKWSFDKENQKPIPDSIKVPSVSIGRRTAAVREAISYVKKHFAQNPGLQMILHIQLR